MDKRRINNNIRKLRFFQNEMTQQELAQKVGVTRQTISSIETGQYCPSALLAFQLAERLGKRVDELFFIQGVEP